MKRKTFFLALAIILNILSYIGIATAADPGHGAAVIGAGTFESGNFAFPNNFTVDTNQFFVTNGFGETMRKIYKLGCVQKISSLKTVSISPGDLCGRRMISIFSFYLQGGVL